MKELTYPFTLGKVRELAVGDRVRLSGRIFTGRDRLHKYLFEGGKGPVDLKDGALYHCGPVTVRKDGQWRVVAAGPTTSLREEPYMAGLVEKARLRIIIGKGGMGERTREACVRCGCVYVQAIGGAAVLLGQSIRRVAGAHFLKEFGPAEALWELDIEGMEGIVTMDALGRSLHKRVRNASRRALKEWLMGKD